MKTEHRIAWYLEWYDRESERLVGEEEVLEFTDLDARRVLERPDQDNLDGLFELDMVLSERLIRTVEIKTSFDFDSYDYFLGKISVALP